MFKRPRLCRGLFFIVTPKPRRGKYGALKQVPYREFPQPDADRNRACKGPPVGDLRPEHLYRRERAELDGTPAPRKPPRYSGLRLDLGVVTEIPAHEDYLEHTPAKILVWCAEHAFTPEPVNVPEHPHESPSNAQESEPAEVLRNRLPVAVTRLQQQHIVIRYLLQAYAASRKVPLDMRELHRQCKLERRYVEAFRHKFRFRNLVIQELHQPLVRKRVQIPRRGFEMRLNRNSGGVMSQVHVMHREVSAEHPFRLGKLFFVCHLAAGNRLRFGLHQAEPAQQADNRIAPAIDPHVDVSALTHEPVRVQARIRSPLQNGSPPSLARKQHREPPSLVVHQAVVPANRLRLARPLESEVQRRPPVLRQLADTRIRDAHHRELGRQGIQKRPLFGGLYVEICRLILTRTKCEPNEGEEMLVDVLFH